MREVQLGELDGEDEGVDRAEVGPQVGAVLLAGPVRGVPDVDGGADPGVGGVGGGDDDVADVVLGTLIAAGEEAGLAGAQVVVDGLEQDLSAGTHAHTPAFRVRIASS